MDSGLVEEDDSRYILTSLESIKSLMQFIEDFPNRYDLSVCDQVLHS